MRVCLHTIVRGGARAGRPLALLGKGRSGGRQHGGSAEDPRLGPCSQVGHQLRVSAAANCYNVLTAEGILPPPSFNKSPARG